MKNVKKFEEFQIDPEIEEGFPEEVGEENTEDAIEETPVDEVEGAEEEEDSYIGISMMKKLASELGEEIVDNKITHNGQEINFYSETEKFHIGRKKFKTVEKVLDFLSNDQPQEEHHPESEEIDETEIQESFLATKFDDFK